VFIPQVNLKPAIAASSAAWRAGLARLLARGHYILGEEVRGFEAEFARAMDARFAIGVANGTQAIELALRDAGVRGDVITSALTAPFTAVGIRAAGCRPRYADIDPATLQIDAADVEGRISKRTAALLPVHLYGQPCALDRFAKLARAHKLALIQDACQAHGARFQGKPLTAFSRHVAYSFYPTKNLPCLGDGGCLTTDSPAIAKRLRMTRDGGRRGGEQISYVAGINSRLDELQCVFLRAFLPHLEDWNAQRSRIAAIYDEELLGCPGIGMVGRTADSVHHLYVIRAERRDRLREFLAAEGIGTGVHYPVPLHKHPAFGERVSLPHAERAVREIVSLPLWPYLKESAARRVADRVRKFYR
jgi:dTDP-3-amino-3,4,6-trideoxy-alpha-D-glucose transaminase